MFKYLLSFLICFSTIAQSSTDINTTFLIEGVINNNLKPIGEELLRISKEPGPKNATLIINSPGGDVITGFLFISQMNAAQRNGLRIKCIVPEMAASMAFGIFVHCNERHALSKSFLLWHRARVFAMFAVLTSTLGKQLEHQLGLLDDQILSEVIAAMPGANVEKIKYDFEVETLHTGRSLNQFSPRFTYVHNSIPGLYETIAELRAKKFKRPAPPNNSRKGFKPGQIIYITTKFI